MSTDDFCKSGHLCSVVIDDLTRPQVLELLDLHLNGLDSNSPPGSVFALDLSGLSSADVTVWSAWHGSNIAAMGELKMLGSDYAEIESTRTHPDYLRKVEAQSYSM